MKRFTAFAALATAFCASLLAHPVFANVQQGATSARGDDQPTVLFGNAGIFSEITNVLLFVIGAVAVIMIVVGGLRYVISGGDAKQVEAAKNTILYAIIGIVIAILAYAIINFISGAFTNNGGILNNSADNTGVGTSTR